MIKYGTWTDSYTQLKNYIKARSYMQDSPNLYNIIIRKSQKVFLRRCTLSNRWVWFTHGWYYEARNKYTNTVILQIFMDRRAYTEWRMSTYGDSDKTGLMQQVLKEIVHR